VDAGFNAAERKSETGDRPTMMRFWKAWIGIELNVVSTKEKLISALGGFVSIFTLILISVKMLLSSSPPLVASMGASAVLLFAVPHGQLSQPWPVIAGHGFSALIGVICARYIPHAELAAAAAVSLSIGAMHQFKCIHPPGGATALTAVIGGPVIHAMGYKFVLAPVLLSATAMVAIAIAFNAIFAWRRYPAILNHLARESKRLPEKIPPLHEDIVEALRRLDSFVDITEEDLIRLSQILRAPRETGLSRLAPSAGQAQVSRATTGRHDQPGPR